MLSENADLKQASLDGMPAGVQTMRWLRDAQHAGVLSLIDQRILPHRIEQVWCHNAQQVAAAKAESREVSTSVLSKMEEKVHEHPFIASNNDAFVSILKRIISCARKKLKNRVFISEDMV